MLAIKQLRVATISSHGRSLRALVPAAPARFSVVRDVRMMMAAATPAQQAQDQNVSKADASSSSDDSSSSSSSRNSNSTARTSSLSTLLGRLYNDKACTFRPQDDDAAYKDVRTLALASQRFAKDLPGKMLKVLVRKQKQPRSATQASGGSTKVELVATLVDAPTTSPTPLGQAKPSAPTTTDIEAAPTQQQQQQQQPAAPLKVKKESDSQDLAKAIMMQLEQHGHAELHAVGPSAVAVALKGFLVARAQCIRNHSVNVAVNVAARTIGKETQADKMGRGTSLILRPVPLRADNDSKEE